MVMSAELEAIHDNSKECDKNRCRCAEYISEIIDNMSQQLSGKKKNADVQHIQLISLYLSIFEENIVW